MLSVGVIGFGAIGKLVVEELIRTGAADVQSVLVRGGARAKPPPGVAVVHETGGILALGPSVVVEAAGQQAVREYGVAVLETGTDLMVISTGALADDVTHDQLVTTARGARSRILLPVGAISGIDGLTALRASGLTRVRYTSTKPPTAWRGTPAEDTVDLDALDEATAFFAGSAREAASNYPKNANLAATVALAGLGLDDTEVSLVADPAASGNTGRIEAEGSAGAITVESRGPAAADNPKTSAVTAYSMIASLQSLQSTLVLPG